MTLLFAALALAVPKSPCTEYIVPERVSPNEDLRCADLRGLDLVGVNLEGADLTGAWLHAANLRGANLRDATMEFAHLEGVNLRDADLSGAFLRRAIMRDTDLYGAVLDHADLCWVDLTMTEYLTAASTAGTQYCRSTVLPEELHDANTDFDWTFKPYFRPPREHLVQVNSLDGVSLIQYVDAFPGNDGPENSNLFDNLGATIGVDVIGFDLVPRWLDATHRHWFSAAGLAGSFGFGTNQVNNDRFTFATVAVGAFVRPVSFLQGEIGIAGGLVVNDQFARSADGSMYIGMRINVRPLVDLLDDLAEITF